MSQRWRETVVKHSCHVLIITEVPPGTPRAICEGCGGEPEWELWLVAVTTGGAKKRGGGLPGKDSLGKEPQFFSSVHLFTQILEMASAGTVENGCQEVLPERKFVTWEFSPHTQTLTSHTLPPHRCSKGWHHHSRHGYFGYSYCWWTLVKEQKAKRPGELYE